MTLIFSLFYFLPILFIIFLHLIHRSYPFGWLLPSLRRSGRLELQHCLPPTSALDLRGQLSLAPPPTRGRSVAAPTASGPLTLAASRLLAQRRPHRPPRWSPDALPSFFLLFPDGSAAHKGGAQARVTAKRTRTGGGGVCDCRGQKRKTR